MNRHEHDQGDDPRRRLISLLQVDFTTSEQQALEAEAAAEESALKSLLADVQSIEDIDMRYASAENIELGQAVERLVEPAPITDSFKGFIAHKVREAHAWQTKVDDVVGPDRLGLLSGEGIFDPERAQDVEAQTLRGYAFDIVHRYTVAPTGDTDDLPALLLKPGVRPRDYAAATDTLVIWADDYEQTYDEDPGAGIDPGAYLDAAPQAPVRSQEEAENDPMTKGLIELLRQLHDERTKE